MMRKIMAIMLSLTLVICNFPSIQKEIKAEETLVELSKWSFMRGGIDHAGEYLNGNEGKINSVTMNTTGEVITGWKQNNPEQQRQTANTISDGFTIDIGGNGWDRDWSSSPMRINPWQIQASMDDIRIKPGHIYTVSFNAYASNKKYAYIEFRGKINDESVAVCEKNELEGSKQVIAITPDEKQFTYQFTNYKELNYFSTFIYLGSFGVAEDKKVYDFDGNDISDVVTEEESCYVGIVYIKDFTIVDKGLDPNYEEQPSIALQSGVWDSFSVRDDLNGFPDTEWHQALLEEISKAKSTAWGDYEYGRISDEEYQKKIAEAENYESYTQGYFSEESTDSGFKFYVVDSGKDGGYYQGQLMNDNPYGMKVWRDGIGIEKGYRYTVSFNVRSTLKGKNENESGTFSKQTIKHIGLKVYNPEGDGNPSLNFDTVSGGDKKGIISLDSADEAPKTVTAEFVVPNDFSGTTVGVEFDLGAMLKSYPDEVNMKGYIYVSDFEIVKGDYEGNPVVIEKADVEGINPNLQNHTLIWSDEFDGNSLGISKWTYEGATGAGGYGNCELQDYEPEYSKVENGNLIIMPEFKRNKSTGEVSYYSTKLWTKNMVTFKYGRIDIKAKLPKGQGTSAMGWLLGENNLWPDCGEIDIFQTHSGNSMIGQSIYCKKFNGGGFSSGPKFYSRKVENLDSEYHVYGIEWKKDKIDFYIDNQYVGSYNPQKYSLSGNATEDQEIWPFNLPFYMILNCSIGGNIGGRVSPTGWTKVATNGDIETYRDYMYIDYVRVYSVDQPEEQTEHEETTEENVLNNVWGSYFGVNDSNWYEGAEGNMTRNEDTAWTANLISAGWGGVWGAKIFKSVEIEKGKEYSLKFKMKSSNVDKYVYFRISDGQDIAFADWVFLPAGKEIEYNKTFTAACNTNSIYFGIGGDFGDRDSEDASYRYSLLGTNYKELLENDMDGDATACTSISCRDFSLLKNVNPADANPTDVSGIVVEKNGGNLQISWIETAEQKESGQTYNIYIDGMLAYMNVDLSTYVIPNLSVGKHTIKIVSVLNGKASKGVEFEVDLNDKQEKNTKRETVTSRNISVGKTVVKSATKKKSAKKAKVILTGVKNATGYEVQISGSKSFKKILVQKKVKKVSFVISSKKLKKAKKLYVRARAYVINSQKVYLGQWTKAKKVKIKK
jgi:beta-glucanase (GH16 family)